MSSLPCFNLVLHCLSQILTIVAGNVVISTQSVSKVMWQNVSATWCLVMSTAQSVARMVRLTKTWLPCNWWLVKNKGGLCRDIQEDVLLVSLYPIFSNFFAMLTQKLSPAGRSQKNINLVRLKKHVRGNNRPSRAKDGQG